MKNKWKIAFWICFILLIGSVLLGVYSIVDQGVTITYMKEGYSDTEADLETLIEIIETTGKAKNEIKKVLTNHQLYEFMNFDSDTIGLERINLIFNNDSLRSIEKQW